MSPRTVTESVTKVSRKRGDKYHRKMSPSVTRIDVLILGLGARIVIAGRILVTHALLRRQSAPLRLPVFNGGGGRTERDYKKKIFAV